MKFDFKIADLKLFLERQLGFRILKLERLPGRSASLNFLAGRDDGFRFVVKCLPSEWSALQDKLTRIDRDLVGCQFPVHRLFTDREDDFSGFRIIYYEYCAGKRISAREVDDDWLDGFAVDFRRLSAELQSVTAPAEHWPMSRWHEMSANELKGCGARRIMRLVRSIVNRESFSFQLPAPSVIHGDFHAGNLFFNNGRLCRVIDLEGICLGYPTEDVVRFFTGLIEHCGVFAWREKDRLIEMFGRTTRKFGYSRREWMAALDGIAISRIATRCGNRGVSIRDAIRESGKLKLYQRMKAVVQA